MPRHESYTSETAGRSLSVPPSRLAKCGNPLCGRSVSLRLEINRPSLRTFASLAVWAIVCGKSELALPGGITNQRIIPC